MTGPHQFIGKLYHPTIVSQIPRIYCRLNYVTIISIFCFYHCYRCYFWALACISDVILYYFESQYYCVLLLQNKLVYLVCLFFNCKLISLLMVKIPFSNGHKTWDFGQEGKSVSLMLVLN